MELRREDPGPAAREDDACELEAARLCTSSSSDVSSATDAVDASLAAYLDSAGLSCACGHKL